MTAMMLNLVFFFGFYFGITESYLTVLTELAEVKWHKSHEDIISALHGINAPTSVDVLYRTALAKYSYLAFDEAYALGVKCIWALAGINTSDAVYRLGDLLYSGNDVLEYNAEQRLIRIATKGTPPSVREAANRVLEARGSMQPGNGELGDISLLLEKNRTSSVLDQNLLMFLLDGKILNIRSNMNEDQVVETLGIPQDVFMDSNSSHSLEYGNLRIQFENESIAAFHMRSEEDDIIVIENSNGILEKIEGPIDLDVFLYELKQLGVRCRLVTPLTSDFEVTYKVGKNSEIVYDFIEYDINKYSTFFTN